MRLFREHKIPGPTSEQEIREAERERISEWYQEAGDLRKLEKAPNVFSKRLFAALVVVASLIALGLYAYSYIQNKSAESSSQNTKETLKLDIEGPEEIASGDKLFYSIVYANQDNVTLRDLELALQYPDNFHFEKAEPQSPENINNNFFKLGSLEKGESKKLKISGQIFGEEDEIKKLTATLTFKPVDFHTRFKVVTLKELIIKSSALLVSIEAPTNLLREQDILYKVKYDTKPDSADVVIKNVRLRLSYPRGFTPAEISPKSAQGNNIWDFESLSSGMEGEIVVRGKITGERGELKELKAEIGIIEQGLFRLQNQVSHIASVIEPQFEISIENDPKEIKFGDNVIWKVKYKNLSDLALQNPSFSVRIQDTENLVKRDSIDFPNPEGSLSQDKSSFTVTFDNLEKLEPQEEGSQIFSLDTVKSPVDIEAENVLVVQASLSANSTDLTPPLKFESAPIKINVGKGL